MASSPEFRPDIEYERNCIMASDMLSSYSSTEIKLTMTEVINPGLKEIHKSFPPATILLGLMSLSTKIRAEGETSTRLELCTEYVGDNIVARLNDNAENASLNLNGPAFAIWQQMYEGAHDTLTDLQVTEEFKEKGVDSYIEQLISDSSTFEEPLDPDLITSSRIIAQRNIRLLQEDPTGFLLADDLVAQSILANQGEFYTEGVTLAVTKYKEAYTIAQLQNI